MTTNLMRFLTFLFVVVLAMAASAQDKTVTLRADGDATGLALLVPAAAKITSSTNYVNIHTTNMSLHIWAVTGAKTVADALPRVGEIIKSEFTKFTVTSTEDVVIAGAPARHVIGSGNEADDGDPGHAEVVFFVVGGHVFAACIHGEFDDAARARAPMMVVLQTAHAPS
jgi:hypothetical protein